MSVPHRKACVELIEIHHEGMDRSKVMDQALTLWSSVQQQPAMVEQFSAGDTDDERSAWLATRRRAAGARLQHRA